MHMSIDCKAILDGQHTAFQVAGMVKRFYGGDAHCVHFTHEERFYQVSFDQNHTPDIMKLRPFERAQHRVRRTMCVFIDGYCLDDYADVTTGPATLITIGASGDARKIMEALLSNTGGYIYDELLDDENWERIEAGTVCVQQAAVKETVEA